MLRRIVVSDFTGGMGSQFTLALEAELAGATFNGATHFSIVDSGRRTNTRAAPDRLDGLVRYAKAAQASGAFFGEVRSSFHQQSFTGTVPRCIEHSASNRCKKYALVEAPCEKRSVQIVATPKLVNTQSGHIVYASQKIGDASTTWCDDRSKATSDQGLILKAQSNVVSEIRKDVAPYNATVEARINEKYKGLGGATAEKFKIATKAAKIGNMEGACRFWDEIYVGASNHAPTIYNRGVCRETSGDYGEATKLYRLTLDVDPGDAQAVKSLERAAKLQEADRAAKAQQSAYEARKASAIAPPTKVQPKGAATKPKRGPQRKP